MIIEKVDESLFIRRFEDHKRVKTSENSNGNFSYKGLRYLFEYLDESHDEENPLNLDVISLCCDFSEYEDIEEYLKDYSNKHTSLKDITGKEDINNLNEKEMNELNEVIKNEILDNTNLIQFTDNLNEGFIIEAY